MPPTISAHTAAPYSRLPGTNVRLFEAKAQQGLTFADIGKALNRDEVWVAAAFYAQAKFSDEDLAKLSKLLKINQEVLSSEIGGHWWPDRGAVTEFPPKDPVIYRLYEGIMVYGQPIKALIHEKFGDGIMSMINCKVHVEKIADPAGDRVLLTFNGKFLPYLQW
ncbi:Cyanase [Ephemerocybe angulata]|uniref:Cyanate hydratase n=1 Tax=Ephemerocybe angulata TaxID=980116 RepID=A0A8H6I6G7_9AGAR|nr:Cyanase [Tulosesus angulatus]